MNLAPPPVPTLGASPSQWWTDGVFEAMPGTWIVFDDDGVIIDVRTRASFAYGEVARRELLGRRATDVLDPPHAATVLAAVASAREGQPVEICEFEWAGPAGRRWYEARVARHDGVVVACVMDIHKSHEERIANERAAAVMAGIADAVVEIVDHTVTAVLGRGRIEPHPMAAQRIDEWLPPATAEQLMRLVDAVRSSGSGEQLSIIVDADHVYEIAAEPLNDAAVVLVVRDRSQEHLLRQAALTAQQRLQDTLAAFPDLVIRLTPSGEITEVVAGAAPDLIGPIESQIGFGYRSMMPEQELSAWDEALARAVTGDAWAATEYRLVINDMPAWFEARFRRTNADEIVCVIRNKTIEHLLTEQVASSERKLRATVAALPDLMFTYRSDGTIVDAFVERATEMVAPIADQIGRPVGEILPPAAAASVVSAINEALSTGTVVSAHYTVDIGGAPAWFEDRFAAVGPDEVVCIARNVTEARKAKAEAARAEAVLDASTDYVVIVDCAGKVIWTNQTATMLLPESDAMAVDLFDVDSKETFAVEVVSEVDQTGMWRGELAFELGSGMTIPVSLLAIAGRDEVSGQLDHIALVARDITEVREVHARLTHLASHDNMTGLPNRALCMDRLRQAGERAKRGDNRFAVLFCDLDGFKAVNDELGHDAGDQVLIEIAARLKGAVRGSDTVARLGGDEFVVVCEGLEDRSQAEVIARRIIASIDEPVMTEAGVASVGISIGLAHSGIHSDVDDVLRRADEAMYRAKSLGKGTLVVTPEL
ncbi:MAG: diguanylate cyclase [Acidimicrobiia bacterium]